MATVTFRSDTLSEDKGATDPGEAEEKECTHTATKDQNESYYTEAIRASKLHDLLSSNQRPNGEGIHTFVGDIS